MAEIEILKEVLELSDQHRELHRVIEDHLNREEDVLVQMKKAVEGLSAISFDTVEESHEAVVKAASLMEKVAAAQQSNFEQTTSALTELYITFRDRQKALKAAAAEKRAEEKKKKTEAPQNKMPRSL